MFSHWIGKLWLGIFGWKVRSETNVPAKFVCVAAPHTSNWDLPFMLAAAYALRLRASWVGKHTIFRFPWGWLFRRLGGIPVDRRAPQSLVNQLAAEFKRRDYLILAVAPEGTRRKVDIWKSGFYHLANESGVPIGLGYLDYEKKTCGLGMFVMPTGNIKEDMDRIRAFYRDIRGKYPELESEPRLQEENDSV